MKRLIGNWKQQYSIKQLPDWVEAFAANYSTEANIVEVIICPPFTLVYPLLVEIRKYSNLSSINLGVQNISQFNDGAQTGEVGINQITDLARYCIVGHSERRTLLNEDNEIIKDKVINVLKTDLSCVLCFSKEEELTVLNSESVNSDSLLLAYEPLEAIGTGNPADPANIVNIAEKLSLKSLIYGGSINSENITTYNVLDIVSGFLVGGASLDPVEFAKIANKIG